LAIHQDTPIGTGSVQRKITFVVNSFIKKNHISCTANSLPVLYEIFCAWYLKTF